ncbi:dnaJ homolog subfamily C member 22 [Daphnia magna]|uniref:dnaJ homolog subfamily C member 22 n=1 Tax=Daphnia magna TaxID=35525 RepID=UPI001E1BA2FE|nr:dnaJ homolog subfamily C member 22 [Daphnia magna]
MAEKSVCVTYLLWLMGGWFGLHQIYLRRDRHAFLIWSSAAGYLGFGLLRDLWRIPEYVKDANEDPRYIEELIKNMKKKKKPPYNIFRQFGGVVVGNLWGWIFQLAIPEEKVFGIDFSFLEFFIPVAIALGVHAVGNVGRIQGSFLYPLIGASSLLILKFLDVEGISIAAFLSSALFEAKAAQWRRKPRPKHSLCRRMSMLGLCVLLYSSLWLSYLYFNAEMTDSSGESIKFRDGVANFLTSPLWTDFKRTFHTLISSLWHRGWQETWKQFMDDLDPFGEHQALKVLGLENNATQLEITAKWRKLSKEWHPDRYVDADKKLEAQEKFMEFSAAYETISKIKTRRARKNNSFQDY